MAEHDFDSFYYMVLVPADPDFKPMLELQSGLPIDAITPDGIKLVIEELASHRELRSIELPCKPKELRFIAGGQTIMAILELTAREHRRHVALLYGVQPNEMDGETISWTPYPY